MSEEMSHTTSVSTTWTLDSAPVQDESSSFWTIDDLLSWPPEIEDFMTDEFLDIGTMDSSRSRSL